jgi:hypothetical protein
MTVWHREWQGEYPEECRERPVVRGGKRHIADVLVNDFVLEFQHSSITGPDIISREKTYRDMTWVIDASDHGIDYEPLKGIAHGPRKDASGIELGRWEFRGEMLDRYYHISNKPLFLDIGKDQIIFVRRIQKRGIVFSGICNYMCRERFVTQSMTEWIKQLAPAERPPKKLRDAVERTMRNQWEDGELGDVCKGTVDAIQTANFANGCDYMDSIKAARKEGAFDRVWDGDSYYRFGM